MAYCRRLSLLGLLVISLTISVDAAAQEQAATPTSHQFDRPIPVVIRMANNGVVQAMLVSLSDDGIGVILPQGRPMTYSPNKVRSVRSTDGSLFYVPAKDDLTALIKRLNAARAVSATRASPSIAHSSFDTAPANGAQTRSTSTFSTAPAWNRPARTASPFDSRSSSQLPPHQPWTYPQQNWPSQQPNWPPRPAFPPNPTWESQMRSMPGWQHTVPASMKPTSPLDAPATNPGSSVDYSFLPPNMRNRLNGGMPPNVRLAPQSAGGVYTCQNCQHRVTSPVELKAGYRCVKCGVVWDQVTDEGGGVLSISPAALGGRIFCGFIMVIGTIVGLIRRMQSS